MDPTLIYSLISLVVGALIHKFWPAASPTNPITPIPAIPGKHPLLDILMAQINHFLINPSPLGNPQVDAFLQLLAGLLKGNPPVKPV